MDDTGAAQPLCWRSPVKPGPLPWILDAPSITTAVSLEGWNRLNPWKYNPLPVSAERQHFHHGSACLSRWWRADGSARRGHLHGRCHQALNIKLIGCRRGNIFILFKNESRGYSCMHGWEPPVAHPWPKCLVHHDGFNCSPLPSNQMDYSIWSSWLWWKRKHLHSRL